MALREHGFELVGVFLTHTHHDHIAGVPGLLKKSPALPVYVHPTDAQRRAAVLSPKFIRFKTDKSARRLDRRAGDAHPGHSAGECS